MEIRPLTELTQYLEKLIQKKLWAKVILSIFLGILMGILINPRNTLFSESFSISLASWLELPGQIFMKLTQMVMIPLVFTSIIIGIVANSIENLKKFGIHLLT